MGGGGVAVWWGGGGEGRVKRYETVQKKIWTGGKYAMYKLLWSTWLDQSGYRSGVLASG